MEITELNLISDFEAGVNCLQNPSLISQFFSFSNISKAALVYSFCKWGALIIAILATFAKLIARVKLLILRVCEIKFFSSSAVSSIQLLNFDDFDSDEDDSDSDDDDVASLDSFDDDVSSCSDGDYSVAGAGRRRFSWSDFTSGKSVVELWDNFTSGFDCNLGVTRSHTANDNDTKVAYIGRSCPDDAMRPFGLEWEDEDSTNEVVSIWDFHRNKTTYTYAKSSSSRDVSPSLQLSTNKARNGSVLVGLYDSRVGRDSPAMRAEWPLRRRRTAAAGVNSGGGEERVYVRDDVTGELTVGDLRNVKSPLGGGMDTWWDADAVIVSGGFPLD